MAKAKAEAQPSSGSVRLADERFGRSIAAPAMSPHLCAEPAMTEAENGRSVLALMAFFDQ
jgi:hypothetical protein